jgi:hypothetical protein
MIGPGKYDDLCTHAREQAAADAAILIIVGGKQGPGFCVQASPAAAFSLPDLLEALARQIRSDLAAGPGPGH